MKNPLPLIAIGTSLLFALARCGTTAPLPELLSDGGTDGGSALRVDTAQLENGIPTVPYLERLQATGGVRPLRWSLDQPTGDLAWVQLTEAGNLFGTPSRIASGNLTVTVHDALDAGAQATLPLSVVGCQDGAQYPCEAANVGACELGVSTCNAGQLGACGALTPSASAFSCGAGCGACDTTLADHCLDGGTCACGTLAGQCAPGTACCPGASCVNLSNDVAHCKSCENDCLAKSPPHMDPACAATGCAYACSTGYSDCNDTSVDGCEVHTAGDTSHCGSCGTACSWNNDTPSCVNGVCQIACTAGFANCDGRLDDGCEINLKTDPAHCGDCNTACSYNHNTPTCEGGGCVLHCDVGYANCNGNLADGCEQPNVLTDPLHCGSSCTVCPTPPPGSGYAVCNNGTCGVVCNLDAGWSSCGGNSTCYDIMDDDSACGPSCRVCTSTQMCVSGGCCSRTAPGGC